VTDDPLTSAYSYEATTLQNVVLFQLITASIVCTIGYPFREEWYYNIYHLITILLQIIWVLYQTFAGTSYFAESILKLEPVPAYFGCYLVAFYIVNTATSIFLWTFSYRVLYYPILRRKTPIVL
jgi:hypothetical protein